MASFVPLLLLDLALPTGSSAVRLHPRRIEFFSSERDAAEVTLFHCWNWPPCAAGDATSVLMPWPRDTKTCQQNYIVYQSTPPAQPSEPRPGSPAGRRRRDEERDPSARREAGRAER